MTGLLDSVIEAHGGGIKDKDKPIKREVSEKSWTGAFPANS
jgi:hypothetical protein